MNETPEILQRGRVTYYLYSEKVVVGISDNQWVSYNQYDNWNRQGITLFKRKILKSKENEYATPVDQMSLAVECGIRGTSTERPKL